MKIKSVFLRDAITVPGSRVAGTNTLVSQKYPGITLEWTSDGIVASHEKFTFLIPSSNITLVVLDASGTPRKS